MQSRIMYIEYKAGQITGPARIGRVTFSRSGRSLYYRSRCFHRFRGYKANYFDVQTGEEYWISGCKKSGGDRLYAGSIHIDEDVRQEYWTKIRGLKSTPATQSIHDNGKYS